MMNIGYCTNIHAGMTLEEIFANLTEVALPVKDAVSANEPMGIGLWFSNKAVQETLENGNWQRLRDFLGTNQLVPHTFNAFPQHDFHQPVVKQQVYLPDWSSDKRLDYTKRVADLASRLLPEGSFASISTLPLGWRNVKDRSDSHLRKRGSRNLATVAEYFTELAAERGVQIHLCLEPEPGCYFDRAEQLVNFYEQSLLAERDNLNEEIIRARIGVCHDVCHSAVMFESQLEALQTYRAAGLLIGKVQISSALSATQSNVAELEAFVERRYLHQTCIQDTKRKVQFFEDLPPAIEALHSAAPDVSARTHFHVPIHLAEVGNLQTTQAEISQCLDWFVQNGYHSQFEVETYAWSVSPESIRGGTMIDSLVAELNWLREKYPKLKELNCS